MRIAPVIINPLIALLTLSTLIAPSVLANVSTPAVSAQLLISDVAKLIGTVNVANLPVATPNSSINALTIRDFLPTPTLVTEGKSGMQAQAPKNQSSAGGVGTSLRFLKTLDGISGSDPNPCRCGPPDMGLGASNNFTFQEVNLAGAIYDSNGTLLKGTFSLSDFWSLPIRGGPLGIGMSDPQVVYDAEAGKWFSSIVDVYHVNRVGIAVSASSDPTGVWYIYAIIVPTPTYPTNNILADQPFIGYSSDKLLVTANDFDTNTGGFVGVQFWVLNKFEMMAGRSSIDLATIAPDNTKASLRPAQHLSQTSIAYMVDNCINLDPIIPSNSCPPPYGAGKNGGATVYSISGTPPGQTNATQTTTRMAITGIPPNADQPGLPHGRNLDTGDNRIQSVVWRNNFLWFALNDDCTPTGDTTDRSCARVVELQTSGILTPTLLQDRDLAIPGAYVFYPALSTDAHNDMVLLYGESSNSSFPSLYVTGQLGNGPANTLLPSQTIVTGSGLEKSGRYGDYFSAATVPGTNRFWVAGEYRGPSSSWGTRLGLVTLGASNFELAGNARASPNYSVGTTCPNLQGTCRNSEGEPSIRADNAGNFYASAPNVLCVLGGLCGGTFAWKSTNGGSTFTTLPLPNMLSTGDYGFSPAGGDTDIAVAPIINPDGYYNIYIASLESNRTLAKVYLSTSTNGGASWSIKPTNASIPLDAREWIAADAASKVCISYHASSASHDIFIDCSYDGGLTFTQRAIAFDSGHRFHALFNNTIGNLLIDPSNHLIYQVFSSITDASEFSRCGTHCSPHVIWIAVSTDGGVSFTDYVVYNNPDSSVSYGHQFPNVATDHRGNVYVIYSDNHNLFYSFSTNLGSTWSGPFQINQAPSNTAIFPWSTAVSSGGLAVAWYGTSYYDGQNPPDSYPNSTAWYVYFAQNLNATTAGNSFVQVAVSPIVHYGGVCESRTNCTGNRDLFDSLGLANSPVTGRVTIIYSDDQYTNTTDEPAGAYCTSVKANTTDCEHTNVAVQSSGDNPLFIKPNPKPRALQPEQTIAAAVAGLLVWLVRARGRKRTRPSRTDLVLFQNTRYNRAE